MAQLLDRRHSMEDYKTLALLKVRPKKLPFDHCHLAHRDSYAVHRFEGKPQIKAPSYNKSDTLLSISIQ